MKKSLFFISITTLLSSCFSFNIKQEGELENPYMDYANSKEMIELQNLETREIIFCLKEKTKSAEECAEFFEERGFVQIKNIPYKPAKYDLLQTDAYPTRRWRDNELTPRW